MSKDKSSIQKGFLKLEGLEFAEKLFRYTNKWHVKKLEGTELIVSPNANSKAMIQDIYESGNETMAQEIGSGLSFLKSRDENFEAYDRICISIDLADVIEQGGFLYPDKSRFEEGAYFLMLPTGDFTVTIEG